MRNPKQAQGIKVGELYFTNVAGGKRGGGRYLVRVVRIMTGVRNMHGVDARDNARVVQHGRTPHDFDFAVVALDSLVKDLKAQRRWYKASRRQTVRNLKRIIGE